MRSTKIQLAVPLTAPLGRARLVRAYRVKLLPGPGRFRRGDRQRYRAEPLVGGRVESPVAGR
jgi:hypothetical protein